MEQKRVLRKSAIPANNSIDEYSNIVVSLQETWLNTRKNVGIRSNNIIRKDNAIQNF